MQQKLSERNIQSLTNHLNNKLMIEREITEWVEKNPEWDGPSVGLNVRQVSDLWDYIVQNSNIDRYVNAPEFKELANKFQETIDFDTEKPSNVKEMVVGLTDTQAAELAKYINGEAYQCYFYLTRIKEWLVTQTFELPEVTEVAVGLTDSHIVELDRSLRHNELLNNKLSQIACIKEWLSTQTFVQPEPKEVAAGLTDEQVKSFITTYHSRGLSWDLIPLYHEWAKTQTFELPTKPFEPDWNNAPSWANYVAQCEDGSWYWFSNKPIEGTDMFWGLGDFSVAEDNHRLHPISANKNWSATLQRRPAADVKIGMQCRRLNDSKVGEVVAITQFSFADLVVVRFEPIEDCSCETSDFHEKFEILPK